MMHEITLLGRSGFFKNLGLSLLFNHSGSQPQRETSKNMVTEGYASLPERDGQSVDHPLDLNELLCELCIYTVVCWARKDGKDKNTV